MMEELQDLYDMRSTPNNNNFFSSFQAPQITNEHNRMLSRPLSLFEITDTLRKSSGTTPGSDRIGNDTYKLCWDLVGNIILKYWEHSLITGTLTPSHAY